MSKQYWLHPIKKHMFSSSPPSIPRRSAPYTTQSPPPQELTLHRQLSLPPQFCDRLILVSVSLYLLDPLSGASSIRFCRSCNSNLYSNVSSSERPFSTTLSKIAPLYAPYHQLTSQSALLSLHNPVTTFNCIIYLVTCSFLSPQLEFHKSGDLVIPSPLSATPLQMPWEERRKDEC